MRNYTEEWVPRSRNPRSASADENAALIAEHLGAAEVFHAAFSGTCTPWLVDPPRLAAAHAELTRRVCRGRLHARRLGRAAMRIASTHHAVRDDLDGRGQHSRHRVR